MLMNILNAKPNLAPRYNLLQNTTGSVGEAVGCEPRGWLFYSQVQFLATCQSFPEKTVCHPGGLIKYCY